MPNQILQVWHGTATSYQRHRNVNTPKNQGYNMQNEYREGTYIMFSLKGIQNTYEALINIFLDIVDFAFEWRERLAYFP